MKILKNVNYVSLVMLALCSLVFAGNELIDIAVSDNLLRVTGIVTLISLFVFVFTYIRIKLRKDNK